MFLDAGIEPFDPLPVDRFDPSLNNRVHEVRLRPEVIVDSCQVGAGFLGDFAQRHRPKALFGKEFFRGRDYAIPGVLSAGGFR